MLQKYAVHQSEECSEKWALKDVRHFPKLVMTNLLICTT